MKIKKVQSVCLILACVAATGLIGCGKTDETPKKHEAITFMAPYLEVDNFIEEVHKTYPEIELEVVPYSGANTTTCLQNMLEADDLPDICTQTFYKPDVVDVSDKMIDLSGYDFTDNYVESRLKDVSDEGALYMLPSLYNCYGITYNKTLLEKHGWKLPTSFTELEELADKAKEAGVTLCMAQIQYPGSAFQYICNIADAGFLGTMSGKQWQKDYLSGKANVSDTEGMMDSMEYIQKWKNLGMLDCSNSDPVDDSKTREAFIKGNALFLLGPQNGIMDSEDTTDKFGLMPYLSEDGSKNIFILNVNRFYGLNKKLEIDPEKLMQRISMVFQDVYLFQDTIKNNIRFGKENATDNEIIEAAKKAQCHDFIIHLPQGYDTMIGEGGCTLSGGEKQRISIARAILKDAPVILLDEATASLDPENEVEIQYAINSLIQGRTVIVIAHKLKTISDADKIIVLDGGNIIEQGTHEQLLKDEGLYAHLWDIQEKSCNWKVNV